MSGSIIGRIKSSGSIAAWVEQRLEGREPDWGRWSRRLFIFFCTLLMTGMAIYFYSAAKVFPFPYEFKGFVGGNVMHNAWMLSQGKNFYVDPVKEPPVAGCYTPGLQFLIAPMIKVFGLKMWVGRLVAIAGLVAVWILMYRALHAQTGKRIYGLLAVGILMAGYGAFDSHYDDIHPDTWTVFWGLLTLGLSGAAVKKWRWALPAAMAGALCYFTKQTGLSFVMGAAMFLLVHRPGRAVVFVVLVGVLLAGGHLLGEVLTDGMFWDYIIATAKEQPIHFFRTPQNLHQLFLYTSGLVVVFGYMLVSRPQSLRPTSPYFVAFPFVFAAFFIASIRRGGGLNNMYPAIVLFSMIMAACLWEVRERMAAQSPRIAFLIYLTLAMQLVILLGIPPKVPRAAHYNTAARLEKLVRETKGEVLVFHPISFAFLNGRKVYDNFTVMFDHVTWKDYSRLEEQLRSGYFERIIIPKGAVDQLLSRRQDLIEPLRKNYELEAFIITPVWSYVTPIQVYHRRAP